MEYQLPHPTVQNSPGGAEPEDEFVRCQNNAVEAFKHAKSPDEKRFTMKQGARCLGRRCDMIAQKALETLGAGGDPHEMKLVLDAQKACHAGSGTVEGEYEEERHEGSVPVSVWTPGDVYHGYNSTGKAGLNYHKIITDARTPIASRLPTDPRMVPEKSLDDMEAEAIRIDQERDAKIAAGIKEAEEKKIAEANAETKKHEAKLEAAAREELKEE